MDHVFITGRRKDVLDAAVAGIGEKATGVPGDVANLNDLDRLYEALKRYGRKLDVIFANAGGAWGYFDFNHHEPKAPTAKVEPKGTCAYCHIASAKKDEVWTQFYRLLDQ